MTQSRRHGYGLGTGCNQVYAHDEGTGRCCEHIKVHDRYTNISGLVRPGGCHDENGHKIELKRGSDTARSCSYIA